MNFKMIRIGRSSENDIMLDHDSISRKHLEVFIDPDNNVFITDLDSSNGTYVNGERIKGSVQLQSGDILKLGAMKPIRWSLWIKNDIIPVISHEASPDLFDSEPQILKQTEKGINFWLIGTLIVVTVIIFLLIYSK